MTLEEYKRAVFLKQQALAKQALELDDILLSKAIIRYPLHAYTDSVPHGRAGHDPLYPNDRFFSPEEVEESVSRLEGLGLIERVPGGPACIRLTHPDLLERPGE
jgi:hypothetical protein